MKVTCSALMIATTLLLGCGRRDEEPSPREKQEDASQAVVSSQALVQVLIYGLAAIEIVRENDRPKKVSVHMPRVLSPKHAVSLARGEYSAGSYAWKIVHNHPITERTITIEGMKEPLGVKESVQIKNCPDKQADAADVGWLLKQSEIEIPTPLLKERATVHVEFEAGTFETCGLTHGPTDRYPACKIRVQGKERCVSEYMVMRSEVPMADRVKVILRKPNGNIETVEIKATGGDPVEWNYTTYNRVFDIAIRNPVVVEWGRSMKTDHANKLRKKLFPGAKKSWSMVAPDCYVASNNNWVCSEKCIPIQPVCWDRYSKFKGDFSGYDRPICPFVGGG